MLLLHPLNGGGSLIVVVVNWKLPGLLRPDVAFEGVDCSLACTLMVR